MGAITYHQQPSYCGKPQCRKCREGIGHGPYWYAYQTVKGRTTRTYIGKQLPPGVSGKAAGQPVLMIRLFVLGRFRLERCTYTGYWLAIPDAEWHGSHAQALLGYLVSCPARAASRTQVCEALWPGQGEAAALRLEGSVSVLQRLLMPVHTRKGQPAMLRSDGEWFSLAGQAALWIDADAFEALLSQAHATRDPGQTEHLLEEALQLYDGAYLPEERDIPWIQARRESLQRSWIGLLLELADLRITREALSSAIDILDQLLMVDPANEAAVQRLMVLLAQAGRRAEALRLYQRFATVLRQEYQMAPLPETRALYEAVQRGEAVRLPRPGMHISTHAVHLIEMQDESQKIEM